MRKVMVTLLALVVALALAAPVLAADLVKMNTCWMESSEAFNIWLAKEKGWDKEEGLDIEMLVFNSGPAQMEALPAKQWVVGGTGVGGQLIGGMRYNIYNLAPVIDEGDVNAFYVRKDSPILKTKGFNPDYPELYGTPDTVKGATILFTSQTTVHYIIGKWLEALGLKESDVKLTNMDQTSIPPAIEKGIGDVASVWAPFTFSLEALGMVKAGNTNTTKAFTATTIVGDKEWCDANPELTAKFLRVYYRASQAIKDANNSDELVALYQKFLSDFCGMRSDATEAKNDLLCHPRWSLQEALAISTPKDGGASDMTMWLNNAVDFFQSIGRFSPEEAKSFKDKNIATDKFLKIAAETPLAPAAIK